MSDSERTAEPSSGAQNGAPSPASEGTNTASLPSRAASPAILSMSAASRINSSCSSHVIAEPAV
jgi:hypothetical protein